MFHLLLLFLCVSFLPFCSSVYSNHTPVAREVFYHNGEQEQVRLLSSQKVESKLVSSVIMILSRELLGYDISQVQNQQSVANSEENTAIQQVAPTHFVMASTQALSHLLNQEPSLPLVCCYLLLITWTLGDVLMPVSWDQQLGIFMKI